MKRPGVDWRASRVRYTKRCIRWPCKWSVWVNRLEFINLFAWDTAKYSNYDYSLGVLQHTCQVNRSGYGRTVRQMNRLLALVRWGLLCEASSLKLHQWFNVLCVYVIQGTYTPFCQWCSNNTVDSFWTIASIKVSAQQDITGFTTRYINSSKSQCFSLLYCLENTSVLSEKHSKTLTRRHNHQIEKVHHEPGGYLSQHPMMWFDTHLCTRLAADGVFIMFYSKLHF